MFYGFQNIVKNMVQLVFIIWDFPMLPIHALKTASEVNLLDNGIILC